MEKRLEKEEEKRKKENQERLDEIERKIGNLVALITEKQMKNDREQEESEEEKLGKKTKKKKKIIEVSESEEEIEMDFEGREGTKRLKEFCKLHNIKYVTKPKALEEVELWRIQNE